MGGDDSLLVGEVKVSQRFDWKAITTTKLWQLKHIATGLVSQCGDATNSQFRGAWRWTTSRRRSSCYRVWRPFE
jgi:hypothetical protein